MTVGDLVAFYKHLDAVCMVADAQPENAGFRMSCHGLRRFSTKLRQAEIDIRPKGDE